MQGPRIVTAEWIGLEFTDVFGDLGPAYYVTGHFSAGPRAGDWRQAVALARRWHLEHVDNGWGGCGYHYLIGDDGSLLCLRPVALEGAHVGGHNGHNIGIVCAGTSGHRPTRAQRETYAWLLAHAHTTALPVEHRTREDLRDLELLVHSMWHGHTTNPCAGWFEDMFLAGVNQPAAGEGIDPGDDDRVTSAGYPPATLFRGVLADTRHVTLIDAHRATARRPFGGRGGAAREGRSGRAGRFAFVSE